MMRHRRQNTPYQPPKKRGGGLALVFWLGLAAIIIGPLAYKFAGTAPPAQAAVPFTMPDRFPRVTDPPVQTNLTDGPSFGMNGYTLHAVARYAVTARVLHTSRYFLDTESKLSPIDFALGWSLMSNKDVISRLSISQGGRFYHWHTDDYPIPRADIEHESANTHIIPATKDIADRAKSVSAGDVVTMAGYLVNVSGPNGWYWHTSLTRNDTGDGACEVFYVQYLSVK
ncbi:MAG: hypothetical protein GC185_13315 [Alphaproteobacteria bacterium]|nr:hypothetical protein [Alphaproteobacteria bacterium]